MTIDEIEKSLPNGFHDASLKMLFIDYLKRKVIIDIEVDIGNAEKNGEDYRVARLILFDLVFFIIEPPDLRYDFRNPKGLWVGDAESVEIGKIPFKLMGSLPEGAFVYRFYISDWNAFIYVAAMDARFEWGTDKKNSGDKKNSKKNSGEKF